MAAVPEVDVVNCCRGLRRQAIVQSLLADVVHGPLRAGLAFRHAGFGESLGVSHTPIREAWIALAGVGVIDLLPNRGVIRRITQKEVREVCQVRRALDCEAARSACGASTLRNCTLLATTATLEGGAVSRGRLFGEK